MSCPSPRPAIPLAVLDPALGRTGAHNLGFAELMLADPPGPMGFWCSAAMNGEQGARLASQGAHVSPVFRGDFYALFHQAGGVSEHWDWIYALCDDYLRALRQVLERWPGAPVRILHHTLSWEHATALSLAIGLLGDPGDRLHHLALLMYSPGVAPDGQTLDLQRRLNFRLAFDALARLPNVALHASCSEHAAAYSSLLGQGSPLPVHPCFLGDWRSPPQTTARKPGRIVAYLGEAKQEKGFLELPQRLTAMAQGLPEPHARFVVHCVEVRTPAARAVMDTVRSMAGTDPRIEVHEGRWSDARLHDELARASVVCLDYDPDAYAYKTSGLLWLAAWHRVPARVPGRTWLGREGRRLGLPLIPSRGLPDPARARVDRNAEDAAYRQAMFTPFGAWLAGQAPADTPPPAGEGRGSADYQAELAGIRAAISEAASRRSPERDAATAGTDVVLFWKQNDSTLYGRRNDMVARYLAGRKDVRRVLVVDAPISAVRLARFARATGPQQSRWIHDRTLEKLHGRHDSDAMLHKVFVHEGFGESPHEDADPRFIDAYGSWLEDEFRREDVDPRCSAFWIYPRDFCMPSLLDRFRPAKVVVDMVDDDRAWPGVAPERAQRLGRNYAELLRRADRALANCAQVQAALREYRHDVMLVPNGCDALHGNPPRGGVPPAAGAVIGYAGNLEAKIDIPLLDRIARHFPQHRLVLVGSTHANPAVRELRRHPNVEMPGVVPYDRLDEWLSQFDVAIIPHLDMAMTRRMHPLKTQVYLAWGIPVVSTAVANVDADGELVRVVVSHDAFLHQLEQVLARPRPPLARFRDHVRANDWEARLGPVVDALELGSTG